MSPAAALRIGKPLADLSAPMDFVEVQQFLDADYPDGGLYYWIPIEPVAATGS